MKLNMEKKEVFLFTNQLDNTDKSGQSDFNNFPNSRQLTQFHLVALKHLLSLILTQPVNQVLYTFLLSLGYMQFDTVAPITLSSFCMDLFL